MKRILLSILLTATILIPLTFLSIPASAGTGPNCMPDQICCGYVGYPRVVWSPVYGYLVGAPLVVSCLLPTAISQYGVMYEYDGVVVGSVNPVTTVSGYTVNWVYARCTPGVQWPFGPYFIFTAKSPPSSDPNTGSWQTTIGVGGGPTANFAYFWVGGCGEL